MILVSSCLCGINCRYNGGNNETEWVKKLYKDGKAVLICPECLGEMETPRHPHEIIGGNGTQVLSGKAKVMDKNKEIDSTEKFIKGANLSLELAKKHNIKLAILKSKSPSCGYGKIYDGTFSGKIIDGNGVACQLFIDNGIKIITEEDYDKWRDLNEL
jgi:Uncharacterized conserved protein